MFPNDIAIEADTTIATVSKIKKRKRNQSNSLLLYCFCQTIYDKVGNGMIQCGNKSKCMETKANSWFHKGCIQLSTEQFAALSTTLRSNWYCSTCKASAPPSS